VHYCFCFTANLAREKSDIAKDRLRRLLSSPWERGKEGDLKDAEVAEYKTKSCELKRSINFATKRVERIYSHSNPHVLPETEPNTDIEASTNFKLEQEMMAFIILVCNGD